MMTKKDNPCYQCSDRDIYCHAYCPRCAEYQKKNEERKAKEKMDTAIKNVCYEFSEKSKRIRKRRANIR